MTQEATVFDLAVAQLAIGDYAPIRYEYKATIEGLVRQYLYEDGVKVTTFRNAFKRAVQEGFYPAFEQGLTDGGSEPPAQEDDLAWINAKAAAEWGFVDMLFQQLKELKAEAKVEGYAILEGVAEARAEGYARTLDGIYSEGKIRGAKNKMLTFFGDDGEESCKTCQKLKGQRHRASWWVKRDLVIYRGNSNYECGCWQCQHGFHDDQGNVYTF